MTSKLSASANTRQPFPVATYLILPDIFLAVIIALGLRLRFRICFFAIFVYVCTSALAFTTGDKLNDYSMGSTLGGQLFTALHLLLLVEPISEYRHRNDREDPRVRSFGYKVFWSACIIHSPRGIGWNYQVANIPPRPIPVKKWEFVRSRLRRAVACFLLMDIAQTYIHTNPLFSDPPVNATIASQGWLLRLINGAAWMTTPYAGVSMQYYILSVISVALGLMEQTDWVDPYGTWTDAYTVRNFWGKVWHQMMRRYISSIGKFISRGLGFEPGTWLSSYSQLYIGFFVSAMMHCFGDTMVGWKYMGMSFTFFLAQPLAITFEDIVIHMARHWEVNVPSSVAKVVGYMWVAFWLTLSLPWYIDWAVNAGLGQCEVLPISLIRSLARVLPF